MTKKINALTGIDIKLPSQFSESYNNSYKFRFFGADNLYPQQLKNFYRSSPTLNACVQRLATHLFGEYKAVGLLSEKVVEALINDYALFGGCALWVNYDPITAEIAVINYLPFESIRLGEQGADGAYTKCFYCADWSGIKTVNTKKIQPQRDKVEYWTFTTSIETRLKRMQSVGEENYKGEILYISNNISYPIGKADAVLPLVSAELGIINATYRQVRCDFMPSAILSVPKTSDEDEQAFAESLTALQGDMTVGKIALFSYASSDEKPEAITLQTDDYDTRFLNAKDYVKGKILEAFNQEAFQKIQDGSLGFSSDIIADVYKFYNFSLRPLRHKIESELRKIEPLFELPELKYPIDNNQMQSVEQ